MVRLFVGIAVARAWKREATLKGNQLVLRVKGEGLTVVHLAVVRGVLNAFLVVVKGDIEEEGQVIWGTPSLTGGGVYPE